MNQQKTTQQTNTPDIRHTIIMEEANDGFWDWDLQTQQVYYSPRLREVLGYDEADMPTNAEGVDSLVHPDDLAQVYKSLEVYLAQQERIYAVECRIRCKDGSYRWMLSRAAGLRDEHRRTYRLVGTFTDITDYKRAEAAEREQRAFVEALLATSAVINSTLEYHEVLERTITNVGLVVPHDAANIALIQPDTDLALVFDYRSAVLTEAKKISAKQVALQRVPVYQQMIQSQKPVIIHDIQQCQDWAPMPYTEALHAYLGVPILRPNQVIGFWNLLNITPGFFTGLHAQRLEAFATQAAVAIENARLYERAQELAAMEERQRLARDLHDAVSQTLFSANIVAEMLPRIWKDDPDDAEEYIQGLSQLTTGALAEMRSLLVELRPETLLQSDLSDLLQQLCNAFTGRTRVPVTLHTAQAHNLPYKVKIVFYRVAQEALNNVAKHARAGHVGLDFEADDRRAALRVEDQGCGFDVHATPKGNLGLVIMHERAASIDAKLQIKSRAGAGTVVQLTWENDI